MSTRVLLDAARELIRAGHVVPLGGPGTMLTTVLVRSALPENGTPLTVRFLIHASGLSTADALTAMSQLLGAGFVVAHGPFHRHDSNLIGRSALAPTVDATPSPLNL